MSGIGLVLNTAKDALLTQQYALDVASHNIANVNTPGFTKQSPILTPQLATPFGGFLFGRGVQLTEITRLTNSFLETRLQDGQTDLLAMSEKEIYMNVMEAIFNENSGRSLSTQFSDFWNAWNDLSNNPSGLAERNLLYEYGVLLAQSFNDLSGDLTALSQEIDNSIEAGVEKINQILTQVADLNDQILVVEVSGNANDLKDKRNFLVGQLSEYMDINTYEYEDGNLNVTTEKGFILVTRNEPYSLDFDGNDINWVSSSEVNAPITDMITGGKLGGWLDTRDEIIPKYKADLDELAKSTVWEINKIHSQGVGLNAFTSVTGTDSASDSTEEMGTVDSGLDFYDKIKNGSFKIWLYDASGAVVGSTDITIVSDTTTLSDLASAVAGVSIGGEDALNTLITNGKIYIEIDSSSHSGYTFAFSDDTSNILAALGINSFFKADNAKEMAINDKIESDQHYIAAAKVSNNVGPAVASTGNASTDTITTAGPYTGATDAIYNIQITATGDEGSATFQWNKDGGGWTAVDLGVSGATVALSDGASITFTAGTYTLGDSFTIDVTVSSDTYGAFAPGDNTNSLAIANLQYEGVTVKQWIYERGSAATSQDVAGTTFESYLHNLVGSVGIQSQAIKREKEYKETIVDELQKTRDNYSAVSLDEEMTDLIKYQQAYSAAAKLISTAEEMLDTLLEVKR